MGSLYVRNVSSLERLKMGQRRHVHAFPFQEMDPKGPPHTHQTFADDAKMAYETKTTVKGPCWLSQFKNYDLIRSTGIDYMHSALFGVMRLLILLWFSTEVSHQPFSMSKETKQIDKRLQDIRPPSLAQYPRSVASHRMLIFFFTPFSPQFPGIQLVVTVLSHR